MLDAFHRMDCFDKTKIQIISYTQGWCKVSSKNIFHSIVLASSIVLINFMTCVLTTLFVNCYCHRWKTTTCQKLIEWILTLLFCFTFHDREIKREIIIPTLMTWQIGFVFTCSYINWWAPAWMCARDRENEFFIEIFSIYFSQFDLKVSAVHYN